MPAAPGPGHRDQRRHPVLAQGGLPGRVELAWTMAGGVLAGGLLMVTATLTGTMNPSLALYGTSLFFVPGAALGLIHGLALGLVGRPVRSTWGQTARALGLGAVAAIPGVFLAWVATLFISLTPLSLSLGRPLLVVAVSVGWMVGLGICAWAVLEGWRALRNALARWPAGRAGGILAGGIFAVVLGLCVHTEPRILRIPVSGWGAVAVAAGVTVWIGLPAVVAGAHVLGRLGEMLRGRWILVAAVLVAAGCGGEGPPSGEEQVGEPAASAEEEGEEETDEDVGPGSRLASLPVTFDAPVSGFPHDAHREIACTRCHAAIEGHATHRAVACSECHTVPDASEGTAVPSRAQCLGCHHEPRPEMSCSRCHDVDETGWIQVSERLRVASSTHARSLPFLHDRHGEVECRSCHTGGPGLRVERACSSCHQEHHRQEAECMSCHASVPLETHALASHEGCSGAGCHADPVVPALRMTRNVCLVCHQDQVDHERGGECGTCHLVDPDPGEDGP